MVEDEAVVETAAEAAHGLVFSRLATSDVEDIDVTVAFDGTTLEVDVYLFAPDVAADEAQIADDAALAAQAAVDDLLEDAGDA